MLKSMLTSGDIDLCIETDNFDPISFQTEDLCDETYYYLYAETTMKEIVQFYNLKIIS